MSEMEVTTCKERIALPREEVRPEEEKIRP